MPSTVTLFSVKIASPCDAAQEATMAGDVLHAWNSAHARDDLRVLLPLTSREAELPPWCDALVVFLHATPGAPPAAETGPLEREIEAYLAEQRPVFIYFSEARVDFARVGARAERALQDFKDGYSARAVVDSFGDEKEFRAKFARQLEAALRTHPHFRAPVPPDLAPPLPQPDEPRSAPSVSSLAQELLIEACEDPEAYIGRFRDGEVLKIQANGRQMVEQGDSAAAAKWEAAFTELVQGGLIREAGCHGRLFQISAEGFDYLKTLGKAPIGYIAELGGM